MKHLHVPLSPLQNASKTQRLSSHFARLLSDREAMISKLAAQESTLKQALHDKAEAEIQLRQERGRLLEVSHYLIMMSSVVLFALGLVRFHLYDVMMTSSLPAPRPTRGSRSVSTNQWSS